MDLVDRMLGHDVWTTQQLLLQSQTLSEELLDQRFDIDDRTLRECFEHIIDNMETWIDLMIGRKVENRTGNSVLELLERLEKIGRDFAELARKISRENRWDDVFVDVLDSPPVKKTYGGGIGHLLTHSMHHRAQVMYMLERLGQKDHIEGDLLGWESKTFGWR
jgi:uncharacterized damage-inducible protein DinB